MALGIDGKAQAGFGHGAFLAHASEHVGERPALGRVIEDVVCGDERRIQALAQFGQKPKPARLVAAMIMDAGEKRATRCRVRQGGQPFDECIHCSLRRPD